MQVVRHQLPASHVSLWLETSEPHITTPFPGPGVFSLETPPVLEELCNTPSSGIAECQRGWWCHQSEVIILLASGEQTWRQQCQGRVSAKKSIMVMPLDSSVAHRACCHLPGDSFEVFRVQAVGQGDPKHLHWYHLGFRAVSGHLGPPPACIWAGDIGMSSLERDI